MNLNRVTKLYDVLTNKERAVLVFGHLVIRDKQEVERIKASIPRKTYSCSDIEYDRWFDAIWDVSSYVAREYWRLEARKMKDLVRFYVYHTCHDSELSDQALEESLLDHQVIMALNQALEAVCAKHGINPDVVREFAGMNLGEIRDCCLQPDAEMDAKYQARMLGLLPPETQRN